MPAPYCQLLGWSGGGSRGRWSCGSRTLLAIYQVFQLFAGLEKRYLLRGDFHAVSGLRVTTHAGLALPRAEAAEAANLDLFALLQSLIDNMHSQFIQAVADGRRLKVQDVRAIADGKVWTGQQALSMKLIDQVADFQAAVADTAKSVGIKGEPTLVRPEKEHKTMLDLLFGDVSQWVPTREKLMEQHVGFYYLWK